MSQFKELSATQLTSLLPINATLTSGSITTGEITIAEGAADGYVLTSDDSGNGTWQPPSLDPSSTVFVKGLGLTSDSLNATLLSVDPGQTVDYSLVLPNTAPTNTDALVYSSASERLEWQPFQSAVVVQQLVVSSSPEVGQFSSIAGALATITDASFNKPYCINVGPGVYVETGLTVPGYVTVMGSCSNSVLVTPPVASLLNVFTLQNESTINNIQIVGPVASGVAAIKFEGLGGCSVVNVKAIDIDICFYVHSNLVGETTCVIRNFSGQNPVTSLICAAGGGGFGGRCKNAQHQHNQH